MSDQPYVVEYASTGRGSCKKCKSSIAEGSIKIGKKVRSPFHDGFDIHWNHLRCTPKLHPSEIKNLGTLYFPDILRVLKQIEAPYDSLSIGYKEIEEHYKAIDLIKKHLEDKSPMDFYHIFRSNDVKIDCKRHNTTFLAHLIADSLISKLFEKCPTCNTAKSLYDDFGVINCLGYISSSTKCDFRYSVNKLFPQKNTHLIDTKLLERSINFRIPKCVEYWVKGTNPPFELQCDDETSDLEDDDIDTKNICSDMVFLYGKRNLTNSKILDVIHEHNGQTITDLDVHFPTHILFDPNGKYQNFMDKLKYLGVPIITPEFVTALTIDTPVVKPETKVTKKKNVSSAPEENKTPDTRPIGKALRHRKNLMYYIYPTGKELWDMKKEEWAHIGPPLRPRGIKIEKKDDNNERDTKFSNVNVIKKCNPSLLEPNHNYRGKGVVYSNDCDIYNTQSTYSDVLNNINKYYIVQIIEAGGKTKTYTVLRAWGRIGVEDHYSTDQFSNVEDAIAFFEKHFQEKTGVDFKHRYTRKPRNGYFTYTLPDYFESTEEKTSDGLLKRYIDDTITARHETAKKIKVELNHEVIDLLDFISDETEIDKSIKDMDFDSEKLPLKSITLTQIKNGFLVLSEIEKILSQDREKEYETPGNAAITSGGSVTSTFNANNIQNKAIVVEKLSNQWYQLVALSSKLYTIIPMKISKNRRNSASDQNIIDTIDKFTKMNNLLFNLCEIYYSEQAIQNSVRRAGELNNNFHLALYQQMNCQLLPLDKSSRIFNNICHYVASTHGPTHDKYKLKVQGIFNVARYGEKEKFAHHLSNRRLLWHGSRTSNFVGILSKGLQIAPPEAPCTGYMFDKGIYFADVVTKSANYCHCTEDNKRGLLLLCTVALGDFAYRIESNSTIARSLRRNNYDSCMAMGEYQVEDHAEISVDSDSFSVNNPKVKNDDFFRTLKDNYSKQRVPIGNRRELLYNEYIVYNPDQVMINYIIDVEFQFQNVR